MADNDILTPQEVTREALAILHNNLSFVKGIDRQYDDRFARKGGKIGDSLEIRLPNRYTVRDGAVMQQQNTEEESVTLQIATQKGVDINFSSAELALSLDDFGKRILKPAMSKLATKIDILALDEAYKNTYNQVGTPGTPPATMKAYLDGAATMLEFGAPMDDETYACINPKAQAATVDGVKGLFQDGVTIGGQYKKGEMGIAFGFNFAVDQNIRRHVNGEFSGTVLVNDTVVSGEATIDLDGYTNAAPTHKHGDLFTIAGVNAVNPESGEDTGSLQQFVVLADKTGSGNAVAGLSIAPAMIDSGAKRTVTALPADGAAILFAGAAEANYAVNLLHHKDAYTLATADLPLPNGADFAAREVFDGLSMRIWRDGDIINDTFPCRIDILVGVKTVRPELACRLAG